MVAEPPDEARHAKLAHGNASYAGYDLGPLSLVVNAMLERCIGKTVAAAEAAQGLA